MEIIVNGGNFMYKKILIFLIIVILVIGIIFFVWKNNTKPSEEMIQALKEANDIINGKVKEKGYRDVDELFKDLDSE